MFLVVNSVNISSLANEKFDNDAVSGNDGQMKRSVAFFVRLVQQSRLGLDDLLNAIEVLIFSAVMKGVFPAFVFRRYDERLKRAIYFAEMPQLAKIGNGKWLTITL